jgi:hypothetical protein
VTWRTSAAIFVAVLVVLAGSGAASYFWGFTAFYSPQAPESHYPKPRTLAEAQRDDLDYLRKFLTLDWSYTPKTRAEASAVIDKTNTELPLPRPKFELAVARVVALADNGHTNVWMSPRANRLNRLPLRFFYFADGLYAVRALPQAKDALGKKVVAVDGHPIEQVRQFMNRYVGGAQETRDMRLPFAVEAPQLLRAAGLAASDDRETLTLEETNRARSDMTIAALPPDAKAPSIWPFGQLQPRDIPSTSTDWKPALRGVADGMLLFANAPHPFFMQALPKQDAFYIRYNANRGTDADPIEAFDDKAEAALLAAKPRIVVIDMRFNGGGDYTLTASFMRNIPLKLPTTRFYVLEGSDTFSAGMTSSAFLKQAGAARTLFVGSRPGDRIRFHAEGNDFCLPFSGICTSARTAIHDYSTKHCRPLSECFALNWFYPVAIKSFEPDIKAPLTYAALSKGHDPALEAIFPGQGF